jgi:hypothetical protein
MNQVRHAVSLSKIPRLYTIIIIIIIIIIMPLITFPPRRYPYFDVVVGLVWSHDPKSSAGGSVCYW